MNWKIYFKNLLKTSELKKDRLLSVYLHKTLLSEDGVLTWAIQNQNEIEDFEGIRLNLKPIIAYINAAISMEENLDHYITDWKIVENGLSALLYAVNRKIHSVRIKQQTLARKGLIPRVEEPPKIESYSDIFNVNDLTLRLASSQKYSDVNLTMLTAESIMALSTSSFKLGDAMIIDAKRYNYKSFERAHESLRTLPLTMVTNMYLQTLRAMQTENVYKAHVELDLFLSTYKKDSYENFGGKLIF